MTVTDIQRILIRKGRTLLRLWETSIDKRAPVTGLTAKELAVRLYDRPAIQFIANNFKNRGLTGVEIGVYRGDNAVYIMNTLNIKKLYLVDPYLEYDGYKNSPGWEKRVQNDFNNFYKIAAAKMAPFKRNAEFIRKKSEDAVTDIHDELDFVYIDGNHDYEFVKKDIELYYPLIKQGGVISGDNLGMPGVQRAVIEFVEKQDLEIHGAGWAQGYEWLAVKK